MKRCNKCNIEKELSEFEKVYYKARPNSTHRSHCKKCRGKYKRELYNNNYWEVYLIYDVRYVGYSKQLGRRKRYHTSVNKFDVSDIETLHICKTKQQAKEYEKIYHDIGFLGKYGYKKIPTRKSEDS